jgi:radical SAM protein with 4Fe4S-binding SPASM domain
MNSGATLGCSISHSFIVRMGDLSICPCHRLSYDHLLYGKYIVENDEIIGIKANNIEFFANNYILGYKGIMKCDTCAIRDMCLKGCKGS